MKRHCALLACLLALICFSCALGEVQTATDLPATLYYNPEGGLYYHTTGDCAGVAEKFRPLTPFPSTWLNQARFQELVPCLVCAELILPAVDASHVEAELPEDAWLESWEASDSIFRFLRNHRGMPFRTKAVFNYVLESALLGGLLICLTLLIRATLRRKISSRILCLLWLLAAVRILLPIALPNPLMNELMPTWSSDLAARPVTEQFYFRLNDFLSEVNWQLNSHPLFQGNAVGQAIASVVSRLIVYTSYGWTGKWVFYLYVTVAVLLLARGVWKHLALRRRIRKDTVTVLDVQAQREHWPLYIANQVKPVPLHLVRGLAAPCVVGLFHPFIALPQDMTPQAQTLALRREILHLRLCTPLGHLLRLLCCALQWFNPLVWVAAHLSQTDMEAACDERAAKHFTSQERSALSEALAERVSPKATPALFTLVTAITQHPAAIRLRQRLLLCTPGSRLGKALLALMTLLLIASWFIANTGFASKPY